MLPKQKGPFNTEQNTVDQKLETEDLLHKSTVGKLEACGVLRLCSYRYVMKKNKASR